MNWKLIVKMDAETASALHGDNRPDEIPNVIGEIVFDDAWEISVHEGGVSVEEIDSTTWEINLPRSNERTAERLAKQANKYLRNILEPAQLSVETDFS